jgi:peptide deformylase
MPIKPVVKMGNQQLVTPSVPVTNFSDGELKELVTDMQDTVNHPRLKSEACKSLVDQPKP